MIRRALKSVVVAASIAAPISQPALAGEVLRSIDFSEEGGCVQTHLRLKIPVHASSPDQAGTSTQISIPVDVVHSDANRVSNDSLEAASGNIAGLSGATFETSASGGQITLNFTRSISYRIAVESETKHIRIDIGPNNGAGCAAPSSTAKLVPANAPGAIPATTPATINEARAAVAARDYATARSILAVLGQSTDIVTRQQAEELLGIALEGEGKYAEAKAQYEQFLARYPKTEAAVRVRQRHADITQVLTTKELSVANAGNLPSTVPNADAIEGLALKDNRTGLQSPIERRSSLRSLQGLQDPAPAPGTWAWQTFGSVSQSYYHQDTFDAGPRAKDSRLLSGLSVLAKGANQVWAAEARINGHQQSDIGLGDTTDKTSLSTAYVALENKEAHAVTRVGRQSRNDGGIFGRFDGAWLGFDASDRVGIGLAAGSPVYLRDQVPFEDGVYFFSARTTYKFPGKNWFADLYAIEQHDGSVVDRRALGSEIRHESRDLAAYAGADYDIYQSKLGSAFTSANWQMNDRTVVYGSLEYRTTPFLLTSNALTGQDVDKLPALMRLLGESQVVALANDRTADAYTAGLGGSYRVSEKWQLAVDGIWMDISGTPASGGVDAYAGTGGDVFISGYLYGNDIIKPDDSGAAGISYAEGKTASRVAADVYWRNPITTALMLTPRLRTSLREKEGGKTYRIAPSLAARYRVTKNWLFETELGVAFEAGTAANDSELQAIVGYRYEF